MLTFLGAVAKLERATILARTAEGRARARERGKSLGHKPKLNSAQLAEARIKQDAGCGMREIGEILGVSASTVSRALAGGVRASQMRQMWLYNSTGVDLQSQRVIEWGEEQGSARAGANQ